MIATIGNMVQGASKKTFFSENWKSTIIFLTNAGDSFCNSYIYHLVGLHIRQWQSDSNTTSSLKNNKTIWDKFITCTHTFTWCQRTAWNFTCVCKSSIWISHCQQWYLPRLTFTKGFFFEAPCKSIADSAMQRHRTSKHLPCHLAQNLVIPEQSVCTMIHE